MNVPQIEPRTVMETIDGGESVTTGKNRRMMWLVLVAIQERGGSASRAEVRAVLGGSEKEAEWFAENPRIVGQLLNAARRDLLHHDLIVQAGRDWKATALGSVVSSEDELHFLARDEPEAEMQTDPWQAKVIEKMLALSPKAFEHFVGKLLGKAGVFDVEVTGKASDGGIDGHGSTVQGPLSVPVLFQAKRYQGSVSSATVRDFRGAVQGRGHLGIIFTTGTFTKDAKSEAERTQAVKIELFDGVRLAEWLKELRMGVHVESRIVEDVSVASDWWDDLAEEKGV